MNKTRTMEMEYMIQKIEALSDTDFSFFYKCFLPLYELVDHEKDDECMLSLKEEAYNVMSEETLAEKIGTQIYELRREMHVSREELCKNTTMSLTHLKNIEQGIMVDFVGIDIILNYIKLSPSVLLANLEAYISYSNNMRSIGNLIENTDTDLYQAMYQEVRKKWMKYEHDVTILNRWIVHVGISNLYVSTIYDFSSQLQNLFEYYANKLTNISNDCIEKKSHSMVEKILSESECFYDILVD